MTKSERVKLIELSAQLEEVQTNLETAELIITKQKLMLNQIIGDFFNVGSQEKIGYTVKSR